MCKFCEENFEIDTMIGERQVIIRLDEENKEWLKVRVPFANNGWDSGAITKPFNINYCPFCGKSLIEEELNVFSEK
ncbi:hypothetical protein [Clostridium brassicae]|uniref:Uncharacterized protein n=1 Tax=Clostridium brassicae TaxID=2999072 RepID=A0ABT4D9K1_9CLOT|nr:hypothetical protein [Clostridium brassicae]MCY6957856.1 hypothetical protein [Clostridium brassicae]